MLQAQFSLTEQPGLYRRSSDGAHIDLLVPAALGGSGRRGARLGPQGNKTAMKVRGIEGALVDHTPIRIASLDERDRRSHLVKVAGPAALFVSKVIKVAERSMGNVQRQDDKDAFDIFRLLRTVETADLAAGIERLLSDDLSSPVTSEAIGLFNKYFGSATDTGVRMVVQHISGIEPEDIISASCVALSQDLIEALSSTDKPPL